jgi:hypothetical protein
MDYLDYSIGQLNPVSDVAGEDQIESFELKNVLSCPL